MTGSRVDRIAVVTGASRGIGESVAQQLAERGFVVAAVARDRAALEAQAAALEPATGRLVPVAADLTSSAEVVSLAQRVVAELGVPDVVVHAAGMARFGRIAEMPDAAWEEMQALNVTAPFILTRELLPHLLERDAGHMIYISSVYEERTGAGLAGYAVSKHALKAFTDSLAHECVGTGLQVTRVVPSSVRTTFGGRDPETKVGALEAGDVAAAVIAAVEADARVFSSVVRLEGRLQVGAP